MARLLPLLVGAASLVAPSGSIRIDRRPCGATDDAFHQFSARKLNSTEVVPFITFSGKGQDFQIIGFPCNQFGLQEPGEEHEIMNGIQYVRPGGGFLPNMTLFQKIEVNGEQESEIYTFLKNSCNYTDTDFERRLFYSPLRVGDIHWNFEKFLVDKNGKPFARYHPDVVDYHALVSDINYLLSQ